KPFDLNLARNCNHNYTLRYPADDPNKRLPNISTTKLAKSVHGAAHRETLRQIECGARHDRDHNAAKHIRDEGIRILLAARHTESLTACGASVRPARAGRSR